MVRPGRDRCRAVAAAVLGDASKVKYTPLNAKERFTALSSGEIDVLTKTPPSPKPATLLSACIFRAW